MNARQIKLFLRLSRPLPLLGGALLFGLGSVIASFLGNSTDWILYLFGQGLITLLQLMAHYLHEFHDYPLSKNVTQPSSFMGISGALGAEGLPRKTALYAAVVCLVLAATLVSIFLFNGQVPLVAWLLLLMIFTGAFFYSSPPLRLYLTGYGELTNSLVMAALIPSFSFALITGELHRLLLMSTTPLFALHFAMMISLELPNYATNIKYNRQTLMVRLGWSTAMRLHDLAIVFGAISFVIAFINGLPIRVSMGALIVLPLAAAQLWQMERIRRGFPTRWRTLTLSALGLFGLTTYLELIGYMLS